MASSLAAGAVRHLPRWPRAPRVTAEDRRARAFDGDGVAGGGRPGRRPVPAPSGGRQPRRPRPAAVPVDGRVRGAEPRHGRGAVATSDEGGRAPPDGVALVETTTRTLGSPRAPDLPMAPSEYPPFTLDPVVPQTPHRANGRKPRWRGLRIGKRLAAKSSDPGMALDGQYFHYVDKWLVALARLAAELPEDDPRRVRVATEAVHVVKDVHPHFIEREPFINGPSIDAFSADRDARQETRVGAPIGVRWKINADASPVVGLPRARPSSDAVSGSIAYGLVDRAARAAGVRVPIEHERGEMRRIARALSPGVSLDALGWGLQAWEAQWSRATTATPSRRSGVRRRGRRTLGRVRARRAIAPRVRPRRRGRPRANGPAVPSVRRVLGRGFRAWTTSATPPRDSRETRRGASFAKRSQRILSTTLQRRASRGPRPSPTTSPRSTASCSPPRWTPSRSRGARTTRWRSTEPRDERARDSREREKIDFFLFGKKRFERLLEIFSVSKMTRRVDPRAPPRLRSPPPRGPPLT